MIDAATAPDDPTAELRKGLAAGHFREVLDRFLGLDLAPHARPEATLIAATAATRLGELRAALELARQALGDFGNRADTDGRMRAINLVGAIAFEHGHLADAEAAFGQALELARTLADGRMAARASNNLASVAHLRGDAEAALSLYRAALLEYQRLGDRRGTAETWHNLGMAFRDMEALPDADGATHEAVRHAEEIGEATLVALAVLGRAELQIVSGETQMARYGITRAATLSAGAEDALGRAEARRVSAVLALTTGDYTMAIEEAESASRSAAEHGSVLLEGECAAILTSALVKLGRRDEAVRARTRAEEIFTRLGATVHIERLPEI